MSHEAGLVSDVVVDVVSGHVEDVLEDESGLFWVLYHEFGSEIEDLVLYDVVGVCEFFG